MPFTQAIHKALLDHYFGKSTIVVPTLYVALSSTTPTATGANVTEPTTGGYTRVTTSAATWVAATVASPSVLVNASDVAFPEATAAWLAGANLTHFVLFNAATVGTVVSWGPLTTPKAAATGDTLRFAAGTLQSKLGASTDTF